MAQNQPTEVFLALVKPNRIITGLPLGASSGALPGRLRRGSLTSQGRAGVAASPRPVFAFAETMHRSDPVYWHLMQPVRTALAGAIRAQSYRRLHVPDRERALVWWRDADAVHSPDHVSYVFTTRGHIVLRSTCTYAGYTCLCAHEQSM